MDEIGVIPLKEWMRLVLYHCNNGWDWCYTIVTMDEIGVIPLKEWMRLVLYHCNNG
jgi:hypothetical protein